VGAGAGRGMACEPEWFPPDPTDDRSHLVGDGESGGTHGDRPVQGAVGRREEPAQRHSVKDALLFGGNPKMNMAFMNCSFCAA
jgi:hypothetical protein